MLKKLFLAIIIVVVFATTRFAQSSLPPVLKDGSVSTEIPGKTAGLNACRTLAAATPVTTQNNIREESSGTNERSTRSFSNARPIRTKSFSETMTRQSSSQPIGEVGKPTDRYVSVSVLTNLGPIGEAYVPAGLDSFKKIVEGAETRYFYPSLFFDISASPLLSPVLIDNESEFLGKVKNVGIDMKWMDVGIELSPWCGDKACPSDALRLLEVLPNETRAGTKDSIPAQSAAALTEAAKLAGPFFPASSFEDKFTAGSGGLSILFNNLFPPKTLTFFHAYIDSPERFGWNFRQNKQKPDQATIMGLHRGIALLQAGTDVKAVSVRYVALSEWNKKVNKDSKIDRREAELCVTFPPKKPDVIDYNKIASLDSFPALVEKDIVLKILHISGGQYDLLVSGNDPHLATTPGYAYVKKSSSEKYLGLTRKKKEKPEEDTSQ